MTSFLGLPRRIKMCAESDLPPGKAVEKQILARRYAVFNDNGVLYGIEGECKHMRAPLVGGCAKDGVLTCGWHGWKYSLETGECLSNPGFKLKRYPVEVEDGEVYLVVG